jgi:hypothetical protein
MGLGSYTPIAPRVSRGGLGAYQQWPGTFNSFVTDFVRVSEGRTDLPGIKSYMLKQINDGIAKLSKYQYQITTVVKDAATQAALKIEYDKANDMTPMFQNIKNTGGNTIDDSNVQGIWRELNEWRGGITNLAKVIEAMPGVVGIGVSSSQISEQAKTAMLMDPAYQQALQGGTAFPESYWTLLKNQIYQSKVLEQLKSILPSESVVPLQAQVDANKVSLDEYKNSTAGGIEALAENNPTFSAALDMAEEGWGGLMGNLFSKYKWWILGAAAVVGVYYVAGKAVEGGFSVSAVTANRPRRKFVLEPKR